ncbi:MAG: HAMP domain-containing histidine kinase [Ruminococcaceae bacterium]|nr:HAMP domain-containing histidine kinase [Oscillospiraceae bacterium]
MKQKTKKFRFKIAEKLTVCFTVSILLFAIVIGTVFAVLFREHTQDLYKENMKQTARSISAVMANIIREEGTNSLWEAHSFLKDSRKQTGPVYLDGPRLIKYINEITDADVWLTDSKYTILSTSQDSGTQYSSKYIFEELPEETKRFILKIYQDKGYEVFGESFSGVLGEETMTVGIPIYTQKGEVTGAVILHTPKSQMTEAIGSGLFILLISLLMALGIGIIIAIVISRTIAKPLKKINSAALRLSEGDYYVKTYVQGTDEIGELAHTIDEMGEKLRSAEAESEKLQKMRQDFVANISHELRTPVTVIRGSMEALCDGVVSEPEKVEEYHDQILGESIYMQRLVNDLLDLSRLQNPDFSINITEFSLGDCVSDAVRSGKRIAVEKGINIDFMQNQQVFVVKGDYDRIRQMLLIIIDNAIKFTDNSENSVVVKLEENKISVTNIGVGIKADELPMIFERFHKSRSEKNKNGTGLGLAIAKQIATRHNADITVSSVEGGETTFTIVFPIKI